MAVVRTKFIVRHQDTDGTVGGPITDHHLLTIGIVITVNCDDVRAGGGLDFDPDGLSSVDLRLDFLEAERSFPCVSPISGNAEGVRQKARLIAVWVKKALRVATAARLGRDAVVGAENSHHIFTYTGPARWQSCFLVVVGGDSRSYTRPA